MVKDPPANIGDIRVLALTSGSGRSSAGGHGNPLQYSCLENPIDRGAWQATKRRVTKSQIQWKKLGTHTLYNYLRKKPLEAYVIAQEIVLNI